MLMRIALVANLAVTTPSIAFAAPDPAPVTGDLTVSKAKEPDIVRREVKYADLDLSSAIGERHLKRRVRHAITDLCLEATHGASNPEAIFAMMRCNKSTWISIQPAIGRAVTAVREARANGATSAAATIVISSSKFPRR